jgi:succinate dehydrogenase / fumarate reductase cytochrome b subunit
MILSILHRITGVAMAVGLVVFAAWLVQAATGPEHYQYFRVTMASPLGQLALVAWTFAFFLHLGNGIRHLVWDAGRGFEKRQSRVTAWVVLVLAVLATGGYWLVLS